MMMLTTNLHLSTHKGMKIHRNGSHDSPKNDTDRRKNAWRDHDFHPTRRNHDEEWKVLLNMNCRKRREEGEEEQTFQVVEVGVELLPWEVVEERQRMGVEHHNYLLDNFHDNQNWENTPPHDHWAHQRSQNLPEEHLHTNHPLLLHRRSDVVLDRLTPLDESAHTSTYIISHVDLLEHPFRYLAIIRILIRMPLECKLSISRNEAIIVFHTLSSIPLESHPILHSTLHNNSWTLENSIDRFNTKRGMRNPPTLQPAQTGVSVS